MQERALWQRFHHALGGCTLAHLTMLLHAMQHPELQNFLLSMRLQSSGLIRFSDIDTQRDIIHTHKRIGSTWTKPRSQVIYLQPSETGSHKLGLS